MMEIEKPEIEDETPGRGDRARVKIQLGIDKADSRSGTTSPFNTDSSMRDYDYGVDPENQQYYYSQFENVNADKRSIDPSEHIIGDGLGVTDVKKFSKAQPILEASEDLEDGRDALHIQEFDSD